MNHYNNTRKNKTVTGFTHERPGEGETNEWYTPKTFFTQLGEHITFDLDPCSPGVGLSHVPARRVFTKDDDGLAQQWEGLVFCNPPYGRDVGRWVEKCAAHGNSMALVFARVDTAWFQKAVATADGVFFLAGRVKEASATQTKVTPVPVPALSCGVRKPCGLSRTATCRAC